MKKYVISATGLLVITMVLTVAVLAAALTMPLQQNAAAFNEKNNNFVYNTRNHLRIGDFEGGIEEIQSSSGSVYNDEDEHSSSNYNSEREDTGKENIHDKPNTGGNSDKHDETEP